MTPTIVARDGKPVLVTGSPGGSRIITTTLQVIVNTIDFQMDLADAVGVPRFHHQWQPDEVLYEPLGVSPDTLSLLRAMGHDGLRALAPAMRSAMPTRSAGTGRVSSAGWPIRALAALPWACIDRHRAREGKSFLAMLWHRCCRERWLNQAWEACKPQKSADEPVQSGSCGAPLAVHR